jgi:hypothetical protein
MIIDSTAAKRSGAMVLGRKPRAAARTTAVTSAALASPDISTTGVCGKAATNPPIGR